MLAINHLDIRYGEKHLFRDVSVVVHPGDRIGLVGVNGTGKSTLMKIMAEETAAEVAEQVADSTTDDNVQQSTES